MQVKIAIIGGGVAGLSSAIYALRANAEVELYEQGTIGGLTATIDTIDNYPSYKSINGFDLANNMYEQAMELGLVVKYRSVVRVNKVDSGVEVVTTRGSELYDSVIVATGTHHNKLGIASEEPLVGAGISYCATCDGNFHRNKVVAIVGSGNTAVKEALYLAGVAGHVHVVSPQPVLSGDSLAIEQLINNSSITVHYSTTVTECIGEGKLQSVVVANSVTGESHTIELSGLFIAIGANPASGLLSSSGAETTRGYIVADDTMMTTVDGIFVAGDVRTGKLKQIVTACGDGATAGNYAVAYARKVKALALKKN